MAAVNPKDRALELAAALRDGAFYPGLLEDAAAELERLYAVVTQAARFLELGHSPVGAQPSELTIPPGPPPPIFSALPEIDDDIPF
jgi:hypothetical protein